jgi:hypothetical protein
MTTISDGEAGTINAGETSPGAGGTTTNTAHENENENEKNLMRIMATIDEGNRKRSSVSTSAPPQTTLPEVQVHPDDPLPGVDLSGIPEIFQAHVGQVMGELRHNLKQRNHDKGAITNSRQKRLSFPWPSFEYHWPDYSDPNCSNSNLSKYTAAVNVHNPDDGAIIITPVNTNTNYVVDKNTSLSYLLLPYFCRLSVHMPDKTMPHRLPNGKVPCKWHGWDNACVKGCCIYAQYPRTIYHLDGSVEYKFVSKYLCKKRFEEFKNNKKALTPGETTTARKRTRTSTYVTEAAATPAQAEDDDDNTGNTYNDNDNHHWNFNGSDVDVVAKYPPHIRSSTYNCVSAKQKTYSVDLLEHILRQQAAGETTTSIRRALVTSQRMKFLRIKQVARSSSVMANNNNPRPRRGDEHLPSGARPRPAMEQIIEALQFGQVIACDLPSRQHMHHLAENPEVQRMRRIFQEEEQALCPFMDQKSLPSRPIYPVYPEQGPIAGNATEEEGNNHGGSDTDESSDKDEEEDENEVEESAPSPIANALDTQDIHNRITQTSQKSDNKTGNSEEAMEKEAGAVEEDPAVPQLTPREHLVQVLQKGMKVPVVVQGGKQGKRNMRCYRCGWAKRGELHIFPAQRNSHEYCKVAVVDRYPNWIVLAGFEIGDTRRPLGSSSIRRNWKLRKRDLKLPQEDPGFPTW